MSIVVDDISQKSFNNNYGARPVKRTMSKNGLNVNLDSPRTQEACLELGITAAELSQKTPESFAEGAPNEEIAQLRYNHYIMRYNQTMRDVLSKRKEIIKHQRYNAQQQQQQQRPNDASMISPGLKSARGPGSMNNLNTSANTLSHSFANLKTSTTPRLTNTQAVPPSLLANYNKTISYLRKSHDTPMVKNSQDLCMTLEDEGRGFDGLLINEVDKFNAAKKMKQKEAVRKYEDDLKRIKMIVDIDERMRKKEEADKKLELEKKKIKEENRRKAEDKIALIKDTEQQFNMKRRKAEESMKQKAEEKKRKIEEEREEKLRQILEHEQRLTEKKRRADDARERHQQEIDQHINQLSQRFVDKMTESQEKYEFIQQEKTERIRQHIERLNEKVAVIKEDRVVQEQEFIHDLVDKIKAKELKNQAFEKQRELAYKEKMERIKDKSEKFFYNTKSIKTDEKKRVADLLERQQKAQERIAVKKAEEENEFRKRQELRILKMQDNQENYERKKRMLEYEQEKILEKERRAAEKLKSLKSQKDIVQKARLEASLQAKIEKERITDAVNQLSKVIRPRDEKQRLADEREEAMREELLAQQGQAQNANPDQKKKPVDRVAKELQKVHDKGFRLLNNVVHLDEEDLMTINHIMGAKTEGDEQVPLEGVNTLPLSPIKASTSRR